MQILDPYEVDADGQLDFIYHPGQREAMTKVERFILILAGTQSGKTLILAWWLLWEIIAKGPGDYLFATPSFTLLEKKALPEFLRLFKTKLKLGEYVGGSRRTFTFNKAAERFLFGAEQDEPSRVVFGHAQDPDSLESATYKAAVLDEAGQKKFRRGSWEAILRRLSIHKGRVLVGTTPYTLGWLKTELYDRAKAGELDYALVQFDSTENPAFPADEYERMRAIMPRWKFNMMYRGLFERPAGLIYDVFDKDIHVVSGLKTTAWPAYAGLDFGGVNTAMVRAANLEQRYVITSTYLKGSRSAAAHAKAFLKQKPLVRAWGGSASEGQWRREFKIAGYPILKPPVSAVELGIDRVYAMLANHPLLGNHDPSRPYLEIDESCTYLIDDLEAYSRELDDNDEPTEKIEDKETWHRLDALRYFASGIATATRKRPVSRVNRPREYQ